MHRVCRPVEALDERAAGAANRLVPQLRGLLGPAGAREVDVVGLVGGVDEASVGGVERRVGPLAADVAADDVAVGGHGRITTLSPSPDLMAAKPSSMRSSGRTWVTIRRARSTLRPSHSSVMRYWRGVAP